MGGDINKIIRHVPDNFVLVGMPGIEPGLHAPEARVLPVYYIPLISNRANAHTAEIWRQKLRSRFIISHDAFFSKSFLFPLLSDALFFRHFHGESPTLYLKDDSVCERAQADIL